MWRLVLVVAIDLMEVYLGDAGCSPPPLAPYGTKYTPPVSGQCAASFEVHATMAPYSGALYADFGGCEPYPTNNIAMYRVGPALPLTQFPAAKITHD